MVYVKPDGEVVTRSSPWLLVREDGRIELLCEHGVGHPVGHLKKWDSKWMGFHGCDGCCSTAGFALEELK